MVDEKKKVRGRDRKIGPVPVGKFYTREERPDLRVLDTDTTYSNANWIQIIRRKANEEKATERRRKNPKKPFKYRPYIKNKKDVIQKTLFDLEELIQKEVATATESSVPFEHRVYWRDYQSSGYDDRIRWIRGEDGQFYYDGRAGVRGFGEEESLPEGIKSQDELDMVMNTLGKDFPEDEVGMSVLDFYRDFILGGRDRKDFSADEIRLLVESGWLDGITIAFKDAYGQFVTWEGNKTARDDATIAESLGVLDGTRTPAEEDPDDDYYEGLFDDLTFRLRELLYFNAQIEFKGKTHFGFGKLQEAASSVAARDGKFSTDEVDNISTPLGELFTRKFREKLKEAFKDEDDVNGIPFYEAVYRANQLDEKELWHDLLGFYPDNDPVDESVRQDNRWTTILAEYDKVIENTLADIDIYERIVGNNSLQWASGGTGVLSWSTGNELGKGHANDAAKLRDSWGIRVNTIKPSLSYKGIEDLLSIKHLPRNVSNAARRRKLAADMLGHEFLDRISEVTGPDGSNEFPVELLSPEVIELLKGYPFEASDVPLTIKNPLVDFIAPQGAYGTMDTNQAAKDATIAIVQEIMAHTPYLSLHSTFITDWVSANDLETLSVFTMQRAASSNARPIRRMLGVDEQSWEDDNISPYWRQYYGEAIDINSEEVIGRLASGLNNYTDTIVTSSETSDAIDTLNSLDSPAFIDDIPVTDEMVSQRKEVLTSVTGSLQELADNITDVIESIQDSSPEDVQNLTFKAARMLSHYQEEVEQFQKNCNFMDFSEECSYKVSSLDDFKFDDAEYADSPAFHVDRILGSPEVGVAHSFYRGPRTKEAHLDRNIELLSKKADREVTQEDANGYYKFLKSLTLGFLDVIYPDSDSIPLYRGTGGSESIGIGTSRDHRDEIPLGGQEVLTLSNPISSWSADKVNASDFNGTMVLSSEVPKEDVLFFDYAISGAEREFVILQSQDRVTTAYTGAEIKEEFKEEQKLKNIGLPPNATQEILDKYDVNKKVLTLPNGDMVYHFENVPERIDELDSIDRKAFDNVVGGVLYNADTSNRYSGDFTDANGDIIAIVDGEEKTPDVLDMSMNYDPVGRSGESSDVAVQLGSNMGGKYRDSETGDIVYVKHSTPDQHTSEQLATSIYEAAGIPVPETKIVNWEGEPALVSKWLDDPQVYSQWDDAPEELLNQDDIKHGFFVDALLASWDVAGLEFDNLVESNGRIYRIDQGGSLTYRAQGGTKPNFYRWEGEYIGELETLRNPDMAPQASQLYEGMTDDDLTVAFDNLMKLSDAYLEDLIYESSIDDKEGMFDALKRRKSSIIGWVYDNKREIYDQYIKNKQDSANKEAQQFEDEGELTERLSGYDTWSEQPSSGSSLAYGGIIINSDGEMLFREPKGHYDGYVLTYAKGRPNEGEDPEDAAIREVFEETGVRAKIVGEIPGYFKGGTTDNKFYIMEVEEDTGEFDSAETEAVHWKNEEDAESIINSLTTNELGRKRDLDILDAAFAGRFTKRESEEDNTAASEGGEIGETDTETAAISGLDASSKAKWEESERKLQEEFKSLNLISHEDIAISGAKNIVSFDDASSIAKQSGFLGRLKDVDEDTGEVDKDQFADLVNDVEKHETITVWHGTNLDNAQGIIETGEIHGDGSYGGGITLSPEKAQEYAGGKRVGITKRKGDSVQVVLQIELPADQFKDFKPDIQELSSGSFTHKLVNTPVQIDSSKVKLVFSDKGKLDHELRSLDESHGGVSEELLESFR